MVTMILDMNDFLGNFITHYIDLEETIQTFNPDLLVLDISLDGADGWDLCKKLKFSFGRNIRVVLFSANRDASVHYKEYQADVFISKPFETNEFITTIQDVLARA